MYLIITEEGNVFSAKEITEELKDEADNGIIDIICITDNEQPKSYCQGWFNCTKWEVQRYERLNRKPYQEEERSFGEG